MSATMTVSYSRQGDVHSIQTGQGPLGIITVDNSNISAELRHGAAKQLLGASVLFCYCSALVGALDARGANYSDIQGTATLHLGTNDKGQVRVKQITVEVRVQLPEEDREIFERCEKIMQHGCLVTGSLHEGIDMDYKLLPHYCD